MSPRAQVLVDIAAGTEEGEGPVTDALRELANASGGIGPPPAGSFPSVATLPLLTALSTSGFSPGTIAFTKSVLDYWTYDPTNVTSVPDGITIVAASGGGVWLRMGIPNRTWTHQAVWFTDDVAGNDENPGTALLPIKTGSEFVRRTGLIFELVVSVLITVNGTLDGYAQTVISNDPTLPTLTIRGQLPVPIADAVGAVNNPDPATHQDPRFKPFGGWAGYTRKANLCFFPTVAVPVPPGTPPGCWAFAFDNDGTSAQITFPTADAFLPLFSPAPMPVVALPATPVLIYPGEFFAKLTNASVTGVSTRYGIPAVVVETLSCTAVRLSGDLVQSRCIWDSLNSDVEPTGNFMQIVCTVEDYTAGPGINSFTTPFWYGVIAGCWFNRNAFVDSEVIIIDSTFHILLSVRCEIIMYRAIIAEDLALPPISGEYRLHATLNQVHVAIWGTPNSDIFLEQDASFYVDGAVDATTFNPTGVIVGVNGTALPPLVPGAVVPGPFPPLTTAVQLHAAPYGGSAIEYMRNCRVLPT